MNFLKASVKGIWRFGSSGRRSLMTQLADTARRHGSPTQLDTARRWGWRSLRSRPQFAEAGARFRSRPYSCVPFLHSVIAELRFSTTLGPTWVSHQRRLERYGEPHANAPVPRPPRRDRVESVGPAHVDHRLATHRHRRAAGPRPEGPPVATRLSADPEQPTKTSPRDGGAGGIRWRV